MGPISWLEKVTYHKLCLILRVSALKWLDSTSSMVWYFQVNYLWTTTSNLSKVPPNWQVDFEGMALVRNLATMAEIIDTIWDIEANLPDLIKIFMMDIQQHLDQGSLTEGEDSVQLDSLC